MTPELKLIFAGPMGAGKTTAIAAISDEAPISTEAVNHERALSDKPTTTVAFDYGEVAMPDGNRLRLYGIPGQARFDFMWKIIAEGALGVIVLSDNSSADPLGELAAYVDAFADFARQASMVIGIGRSGVGPDVDGYAEWLAARGLCIPAFEVDVRRRDDVLLLVDALLSQIEVRQSLSS